MRERDRPSEPSSARSLAHRLRTAVRGVCHRRRYESPLSLPLPPSLRLTRAAHIPSPLPLAALPVAAVAARSGGVSGGKLLPVAAATTPAGELGDPAAAGCCLKRRRELFRVGWVRPEGEGKGEEGSTRFPLRPRLHTARTLSIVVLLHSLKQSYLDYDERRWKSKRARSPSPRSPT